MGHAGDREDQLTNRIADIFLCIFSMGGIRLDYDEVGRRKTVNKNYPLIQILIKEEYLQAKSEMVEKGVHCRCLTIHKSQKY